MTEIGRLSNIRNTLPLVTVIIGFDFISITTVVLGLCSIRGNQFSSIDDAVKASNTNAYLIFRLLC